MLTRAHIRGFKSLRDIEVQLSPLVVLLGPNASGKSNFLEALFLLSRLVTRQTVAEALEPPLRGYPVESFSLPNDGLKGLLSQMSARLWLEADVRPSGGATTASPDRLRYRVGIQIKPQRGDLEVIDEYLVRLNRKLEPKHKPRIEPVDGHLVVRRLGEAGQPRQEPLGLNHTLVSNLQFSGDKRYPDFDRLRAELAAWRIYYLDPRVAMREPQPPKETTDIGSRGELIAPFLHRLKETPEVEKHFGAVARALHAAIPTIDRLEIDPDEKRGTLDLLVYQQGTPYSLRVISEGTLRILALCAIAANPWPSALVAFEEPENGVHPRRVDVIADLLISMAQREGRQVIVTTHSPRLAAAIAARQRESKGLISLLRCTQEGRETQILPFDPARFGALFKDSEIQKALTGPEDAALVEAMLVRGWLDG